MNHSIKHPFCHICKELHARPNLVMVAKSEQNEKRVSFVVSSNES